MAQNEGDLANTIESTSGRSFADLQGLFYHYMKREDALAKATCYDYVIHLRFLAGLYTIDENISEEGINEIIEQEEKVRDSRDKYKTPTATQDFKVSLRKFLQFVRSDYLRLYDRAEREEETRIRESTEIAATTKAALIQARVGQGAFRKNLVSYWSGKCAVSGCKMTQMLVASHIKPWASSSNSERLDVFNGILLLPNYDKLFDLGLMTFDEKGQAVYSHLIVNEEKQRLGLHKSLMFSKIESRHLPYLQYHNEKRFIP